MQWTRREIPGLPNPFRLRAKPDETYVNESAASQIAGLTFDPYLCPRVWGGQRFAQMNGLPPVEHSEPIGESWILSGYPDHVSRVRGGRWDGASLNALWQQYGGNWTPFVEVGDPQRFPLLVKLLECQQPLSVQVHPSNSQAAHWQSGSVGKAEAWVVLEAAPGSCLYAGFREGVTEADVVRAMNDGTLRDLLHRVEPRVGDSFSIPAGTVHAISSGLLLLEVQQSSDATFRLFDWNRRAESGPPRPLHIPQALSCIDWQRGPICPQIPQSLNGFPAGVTGERLVGGPHFILDRVVNSGTCWQVPAEELTVWIQLTGRAEMSHPNGERYLLEPGGLLLTLPQREPWTRSPVGGLDESAARVTLPPLP